MQLEYLLTFLKLKITFLFYFFMVVDEHTVDLKVVQKSKILRFLIADKALTGNPTTISDLCNNFCHILNLEYFVLVSCSNLSY